MARLEHLTDLPASFSPEGVQFAWDSTSLSAAMACLYKYKLTMIDSWQPRHLSVHLRFGALYASAVEGYHKLRAGGCDHDTAVRSVTLTALTETWTHETTEDGERIPGTGSPEPFADANKTRETLVRSIVWYLDHFAEDTVETVILTDGTPAVEYTFALEVDDGIIFSGHLDRLGTFQGHPYVLDNKTTKATITPRYFEGFSPDVQMSMYTFAGNVILDSPVKGVIIDAAQIAVGFTRFERGFAFRTTDQLNEWYDDAMHHIELARTATRENHFPRNYTACANYGGCPFRSICSRTPAVRPQFLEGDFIQVPRWDPLKAR